MKLLFGIILIWGTIAHVVMGQDLDCTHANCEVKNCSSGFVPETPPDSCCPTCVPDNNSTRCTEECPPTIKCAYGTYIPEGKCCPVCCSGICPLIGCLYGSYVPVGQCCPVCNSTNCTDPCPRIKCPNGSYTPEGRCCPECYPSDCRDVKCPAIACFPERAVRDTHECCPVC